MVKYESFEYDFLFCVFVFSNGSLKYRKLYFGGVISDVGSIVMILMFEGVFIYVFV